MSFSNFTGNCACPICGTWQGPSHGDMSRWASVWCDECLEMVNCEECQEEAMDEKSVRVADEVFVAPFDAEYEGEVEPDFDDLDA